MPLGGIEPAAGLVTSPIRRAMERRHPSKGCIEPCLTPPDPKPPFL